MLDIPLAQAAREMLAPYGLTSLEEARMYMLPDHYDDVVRRVQDLAVARVRGDRTLLDCRTIAEEEIELVAAAVHACR